MPPRRASLLPHITRANLMAMRDKPYTTSCSDLLLIKENGWSEHQGAYVPVMCLSLPAPQAVIELTKCSCKSDCKGRCGCFKNAIFHALLFVNALERTVQIHSQATHELMTRKRMMVLLVHKNFSHILWTNTFIGTVH